MWKNPVFQYIITLFVVGIVIYLGVSSVKLLWRGGNVFAVIGKFLLLILMLGMIMVAHFNPQPLWDATKKVSGFAFNLGEESLDIAHPELEYLAKGDKSANYWIPYFNLWNQYNVGYSLKDKQNKVLLEGKPEEKEIILPKIGEDQEKLWGSVLANSFLTEGISQDAYRVIDHIKAPRVELERDIREGSGKNVRVTQNENLTELQVFFDLGTFLTILLLFLVILIKLMVFIDLWFSMYCLIFEVTLKTIGVQDPFSVVRRILFDIVLIVIIGLITSLIISIDLITSGIFKFIIVLFEFFIIFRTFNSLGEFRDSPYILNRVSTFIRALRR